MATSQQTPTITLSINTLMLVLEVLNEQHNNCGGDDAETIYDAPLRELRAAIAKHALALDGGR